MNSNNREGITTKREHSAQIPIELKGEGVVAARLTQETLAGNTTEMIRIYQKEENKCLFINSITEILVKNTILVFLRDIIMRKEKDPQFILLEKVNDITIESKLFQISINNNQKKMTT